MKDLLRTYFQDVMLIKCVFLLQLKENQLLRISKYTYTKSKKVTKNFFETWEFPINFAHNNLALQINLTPKTPNTQHESQLRHFSPSTNRLNKKTLKHICRRNRRKKIQKNSSFSRKNYAQATTPNTFWWTAHAENLKYFSFRQSSCCKFFQGFSRRQTILVEIYF